MIGSLIVEAGMLTGTGFTGWCIGLTMRFPRKTPTLRHCDALDGPLGKIVDAGRIEVRK